MLTELTETIRRSAGGKAGFGKAIELDLGESGAIRIDGTGEEVAVSNQTGEADTVISMAPETLQGLMKGEVNAPIAVMTGKIKIRGDASLALMLAKFVG